MLQYHESAYSSRYLVNTTPPTALSKCYWNFTGILLVVWGYTCALVILKLCFLIFFFLIFSTFLASIFVLLQYLGKWYRTNGPLVKLLIFNSSNKNKAGDINSQWNLLVFLFVFFVVFLVLLLFLFCCCCFFIIFDVCKSSFVSHRSFLLCLGKAVRIDSGSSYVLPLIIEPAHDKTYNKTCVPSKDWSAYTYSVLNYPSLDSPESVEDTCDQRRLWSGYAVSSLITQV